MLSDNERLYDISTRIAAYTEQVKTWQSAQFSKVIKQTDEEVTDLLGRVSKYETLDGLTKAELNKLVVDLRQSQSRIYTAYTQDLIDKLNEFMGASMEVNRRSWVAGFTDQSNVTDEDAKDHLRENHTSSLFGIVAITDSKRMWSKLTSTPIPANGFYLSPFILKFSSVSQASVENIVRKGWANSSTPQEVLAEITGSQADKTTNHANAVIHTAMAFIASTVSGAVISALTKKYIWLAIMDSHTTKICTDRNMNVYSFLNGPLPPAHIGCRSHIAPYPPKPSNETFTVWLNRQPAKVKEDLSPSDRKYHNGKALSIKRFVQKVPTILAQ